MDGYIKIVELGKEGNIPYFCVWQGEDGSLSMYSVTSHERKMSGSLFTGVNNLVVFEHGSLS